MEEKGQSFSFPLNEVGRPGGSRFPWVGNFMYINDFDVRFFFLKRWTYTISDVHSGEVSNQIFRRLFHDKALEEAFVERRFLESRDVQEL